MNSAIFEYLKDILICPDCSENFNFNTVINNALTCISCNNKFPIEEGIIILKPSKIKPVPHFYNNSDHSQYIKTMDELHEDHYRKRFFSSKFEFWLKNALLKLIVNPIVPFVDIGCGTGSGFNIIGAEQDIIGVDVNLVLLKKCREKYPDATLICCDMTCPPFKPQSFKTIFSICALEHIFYIESVVDNIERILHDEGFFYVAVPTEGGMAWTFMRNIFTAPRYSRMFNYDYKKALSIEHCNTIFTIENILNKYFIIDGKGQFPLPIGSKQFNLGMLYRLKKRGFASEK